MGILGRIFMNIFTWGNKRPRRLCYFVGLYTLGSGLYDTSYASITHNLREKTNFKQRYGKNTWVVITGANNPLSIQFALKFANAGFNLLLLDENSE